MVRRGLGRRLRWGYPRLAGTLLDISANEPPHDLRGCGVLRGAQALEKRLLPRIDEDRESGSAIFEAQAGSRGLRYVRRILL